MNKSLVIKRCPKRGQIACEVNNYENKLFFFFTFTKHDEEIAVANDKQYYVIEDNPVPSIDKKDLIAIKRVFEDLNSMDPLVNDEIRAWQKVKEILKNGVETNNEQPFFGKDDKQLTFSNVKKIHESDNEIILRKG